ncbi:glutamate ABC transporter substrate-binding protein [Corynebacterium testudinoris]|uniref:glutamate ABC transporter substrate-binding protein n=1 Tax=Corynebacterium testudinoris TaxID=136857 RepID=UPI001C8C0F46|nr:glutamate ABC transporter substrate-binding protein [Corynebacterium testudinoris]MBX8996726.1 glutamate ABC transporter substrate-binding protein [Corynebacterium testudinoris]
MRFRNGKTRHAKTRFFATLLAVSIAASACTPLNFESLHPTDTPDDEDRPAAHAYGPPLPAGATVENPGDQPPQEINTSDIIGSFRPDDRTPIELIPRIVHRGRIIVGVDQSQNLLSYRDSVTGELRGFEVDLAREISRDIFGDPDRVDFRFIESASRAEALENHDVDMVIRTMTVTRLRQEQVLFSTPYLTTDSRLLVIKNSDIKGVAQLPGRTVCVTDGSTALEKARLNAPQSRILKTRSWADCLVALQQHQADAILSDDTILSGIAAQDPYTAIVGSTLASESYAVAMPLPDALYDSVPLTRQVNSTIERLFRDGTWWQMYNRWFAAYNATAGPPPLNYRAEDPDDAEKAEEEQ